MAAHSATTTDGVSTSSYGECITVIPQVLEQLFSFGPTPSVANDDTRLELAQLARTLYVALKTPREMMIEHNRVQVCFRALSDFKKVGFYTSQDAMQQSLLATMQVSSKQFQIHHCTSFK